ncbi:hypothetical protein [Kineothrix sedimenti]|uniref:Uncharacterized protein n=1 Tax=Kineothrix sedimenti TaxID=3123317 RepID=A0ABZ3ESE4_9FIRM
MLIRSQSKKQLINFSNYHGVAISYKNDCDFGVCAVYEMQSQEVAQVEMGNYSTEEKAIKVLDMIQNAYTGSLWTENHYDYTAQTSVPGLIANNVVLQMPQDSEV